MREGFGQTHGAANAYLMTEGALDRRTPFVSTNAETVRRNLPLTTLLAPMRPAMPLLNHVFDKSYSDQAEVPDRGTPRNRTAIEDIVPFGDLPPMIPATNAPSTHLATPMRPTDSTDVRVAGLPWAPAPGTWGG